MTDDRGSEWGDRTALDAIDAVVADCLARIEREGEGAVDAACRDHPDLASGIRARIEALRGIGLLAPRATGVGAIPDRLGEFRILERLGGGGMGVVYLAEQASLGRRVALKLVRPENLYFGDSRERFRREVEAVAKLQHPGIVPVHSVGEEGGVPYFAMEHVVGSTLAAALDRLRDRPSAKLCGRDLLEVIREAIGDAAQVEGEAAELFLGGWEETCLRLARQVAAALHHAHERGILHRDVKPSNIMITCSGRVMLLDFGLARLEGASEITRTGSQLGSLPYMSPEQVRGIDREVDRRTDVYGLGVTLYEMLTLRSPYDCENSETARRRILEGAPPAPRSLAGELSWEAETVCLKAMERDAGRRYASAAAFARDLDHVLQHRPIEARRAGLPLRMRRWIQRHPARATGIALGFFLVAVPPSLFVWQRTVALARTQRLRWVAESTNLLPRNPGLSLLLALEGASGEVGLAERNVLTAALNSSLERKTLLASGVAISLAIYSPDGSRIVTCAEDAAVRVWDSSTSREMALLEGHRAQVLAAAFSADGRWLATGGKDRGVRLWDADSWECARVLEGSEGDIYCVAFSPDAQLLLATSETLAEGDPRGSVRVYAVNDGALRLPVLRHEKEVYWAGFSPDGARILSACYDGTASEWDAATGRKLLDLRGHAGYWKGCRKADYHPDGQRIVTASADRTARVWDARDGRTLHVLEGHEREVIFAAFSPDGARIVTSAYDNTARLWDTESGRELSVLKGHSDKLAGASFSPDGELLATASTDGTARIWEVQTGLALAELRGHTSFVNSVRFAPDGASVLTASGDGTARVWDATTASIRSDLGRHDGEVVDLDLSPDGTLLATASRDGKVFVWDTRTRRRIAELGEHGAAVMSVAFGAQGRVLLTTSLDRSAIAWDVRDRSVLRRIEGQDLWIEVAALDGAEEHALIAFGGVLRVHDLGTGEILDWPKLEGNDYLGACFHPDSGLVLTRTNELAIWEAATGTLQSSHRMHAGVAVFNSDGRFVVAGDGSGKLVVLDWSSDPWSAVKALHPYSTALGEIRFSPDAEVLAVAVTDGTLALWSWPDLECLATWTGFPAVSIRCRYSSDSRRLLAVGGGVVRVFDVATRSELATLRSNESEILCADFTADASQVVLGFADGLVRIWEVFDDPRGVALARRPRELGPAERARFGR